MAACSENDIIRETAGAAEGTVVPHRTGAGTCPADKVPDPSRCGREAHGTMVDATEVAGYPGKSVLRDRDQGSRKGRAP